MAIDERALKAAADAYTRAMGFEPGKIGKVLSQRRDTAISAAITAYEAAKPVAPMGTSGGIVGRIIAACDKLDKAFDPAFTVLWREAASRIESLEALVAEKEGEATRFTKALQSIEFQCETAIINLRQMPGTDDAVLRAFVNLMTSARDGWQPRALTAEAALAKDASPTPPVGG